MGTWRCTWESSTRTPPSEPSATEFWELYVGREVPTDILKKERLDKELMRIGRHEHMKQLDETKRELDFAAGGPTVRMMFVGKRSKDTKKKSKKEIFFPPKGGVVGSSLCRVRRSSAGWDAVGQALIRVADNPTSAT